MTVNTTIQVSGVKETINALKKIDPQLQKDFRAQAKQIAEPAIKAAQDMYTQVPLSGMAYKWSSRGRQLFPFSVAKAKSGVKLRIDTRRNAVGVILIEQKNPATAVFEGAGRKDTNRLGTSLDSVSAERGFAMAMPGRTRLIGPAVYKARRGIETEMEKMVLKTINQIQKDLN